MTLTQLSCEEFVHILSGKEPVPGGGGAAALVGAIGMALGNMVGALTLGKKKYADVEADILALRDKADQLQVELLRLVAADAAVFEPLSRAYAIPKDDPARAEIMENALLAASRVPLEIMRACCRAIDLQAEFAAKGSAIAISDAGCGVICCKSALQAASLNVFINTKFMMNRETAARLEVEADSLLEQYTAKADTVFAAVLGRLR